MKKTITKNERLQGHGLMALIKGYYTNLQECCNALSDLIEDETGDAVADAVYGDECYDFDSILKDKGIDVTDD